MAISIPLQRERSLPMASRPISLLYRWKEKVIFALEANSLQVTGDIGMPANCCSKEIQERMSLFLNCILQFSTSAHLLNREIACSGLCLYTHRHIVKGSVQTQVGRVDRLTFSRKTISVWCIVWDQQSSISNVSAYF